MADHLFESRHEWFSHEMNSHRNWWKCIDGCDQEFNNENLFQEHFLSLHADLASNRRTEQLIASCARQRSSTSAAECILCNAQLDSFTQLRHHLGKHQEELALFAIPKYHMDKEGGEVGDNSDIFSDASTAISDDQISDSPVICEECDLIFEGTRAKKTEAFYRHVEAAHSAVNKPLKDLGKGKGKASTEEGKQTSIGTPCGDIAESALTVASGQQATWDLTMQPSRESSTETDLPRQDRSNDPPSSDDEKSITDSNAVWTDFRLADAMHKGKERAMSSTSMISLAPLSKQGSSIVNDSQPPSLHGSTSSLISLSRPSIDTEIIDLYTDQVRLPDNNGELIQPDFDPTIAYECVFWFLGCSYVSQDRSEWESHCMEHFRGNAPPQSVQCPLCDWGASSDDNASAWNAWMDHLAVTHFSVGDILRTSRADIPLFTHLWQQRLIGDRNFQKLRGLCWSS